MWPNNHNPGTGQTVTLSIEVQNINDLLGAQFDINYDSTRLQYNSKTDGNFLDFCTAGDTSTPGTIANLACTSTAGAQSGTGTLMTLTFTTTAAGTAPLSFNNIILLDSNSNPITETHNSITLTIT
jgi:hypothetical protein